MATAALTLDPATWGSQTFNTCSFGSLIQNFSSSGNTINNFQASEKTHLRSIHDEVKTVDKRDEDAKGTGTWLYSATPGSDSALSRDTDHSALEGDSARFCDFRDDFDTENMTLACPGYPGVGKTQRAVTIKDHLSDFRYSFPKPYEIAVSALYLGHEGVKTKSFREVILYLFEDLAQQCQASGLRHPPADVLFRTLSCDQTPTDEVVFQAFDSVCKPLRTFYIVVDGLEEYPYKQLEGLLSFLNKLQSRHKPRIKMYVTFRPMEDIAKRFQGCKSFNVVARDVDIKAFIDNKINDSRKLRDYVDRDPGLREMIKSAVLKVADKMFIIAWAHMRRLAEDPTPGDLKRTLSELPRLTADDFYRDELRKIRKSGGKESQTGLKILSLVYLSGQRLNLEALQYAVALEHDAETAPKDEDLLSATEITSLTRSLVLVYEGSGRVCSVHQTARTYFDAVRWCDFPEASQDIISICAKHLSLLGTEAFPTTAEFAQHAFTNFALTVFGDQIRHIEAHPDATFHTDEVTLCTKIRPDLWKMSSIDPLLSGAAQSNPTSWRLKRCVMDQDLRELLVATVKNSRVRDYFFSESSDAKKLYDNGPTNTVPLHFGALLGSRVIVNALLESGASSDDENSQHDTALTISMKLGFEKVVNILLHGGASFDLRYPSGWDVLLHTMAQDAEDDRNYAYIAKHALEKAAAQAKKKKYSKKANSVLLLKSAYDGHYGDFARVLPRCGKVHVDSELFIAALLIAVEQKRPVLRESFSTDEAFEIALRQEYERNKIIDHLLEQGTDINGHDRSGNTVLHRAARWNNMRIAENLLERGADPNIRNTAGHTPWYTICYKPTHQTISRLLIDNGGDPDTRDNDGVSCLYNAAAGGHIESMIAILEAGTNPEIQTPFGWQPLHWAAGNGHYEATKLLLEWDKHTTRANPNCLSNTTETPLDRATISGHMEIIELLKEHGGKTGKELLEVDSGSSTAGSDAEIWTEFWTRICELLEEDRLCTSSPGSSAGSKKTRASWKNPKTWFGRLRRNRRSSSETALSSSSTTCGSCHGYESSVQSPSASRSMSVESRGRSESSRSRSDPTSPHRNEDSPSPGHIESGNDYDDEVSSNRNVTDLDNEEPFLADDQQHELDCAPLASDGHPRYTLLAEALSDFLCVFKDLSPYERQLAAHRVWELYTSHSL